NISHQLNTLGNGVLNAVTTGINAAEGKFILIYAADEIGPVLSIANMMKHLNNAMRWSDVILDTR
ncbi:MAG: hypothetical protein K0U37_01725, partial [Gammaproteobacteria bacterium]|nr:hypothetical protein [Gammaproteobacteria bacterium]